MKILEISTSYARQITRTPTDMLMFADLLEEEGYAQMAERWRDVASAWSDGKLRSRKAAQGVLPIEIISRKELLRRRKARNDAHAAQAAATGAGDYSDPWRSYEQ